MNWLRLLLRDNYLEIRQAYVERVRRAIGHLRLERLLEGA
jgi:hypothetical protein